MQESSFERRTMPLPGSESNSNGGHVNFVAPTRFTDYSKRLSRRILTIDLAVIFISVIVGALGRWGGLGIFQSLGRESLAVFLSPLIWFLALSWEDAWRVSGLVRNAEIYYRVIRAGARVGLALAAISFILHFSFSRGYIIFVTLFGITTLLIERYVLLSGLDKKRRNGLLTHKILVVTCCSTPDSQEYALFSDEFSDFSNISIDFTQDSWSEAVANEITKAKSDYVFVCHHFLLNSEYLNEISRISDLKKTTLYFPDPLHQLSPRRRIVIQSQRIFALVDEPALLHSKAVFKRSLDIILSSLSLIVLFPLLAVIALLIKVTSKGSVLYIDERVGRADSRFNFPKFRTMYEGSDQKRLDILGRPDAKMADRYRRDPRITPLGRILRRFSLDELPQLWSVLIGDMSIVGPRPILPQEIVQMDAESTYRSIAVPGLTGLWQTNGRKETTWEERMAFDVEYIHKWTPLLDAMLILKTVTTIISGKGAY